MVDQYKKHFMLVHQNSIFLVIGSTLCLTLCRWCIYCCLKSFTNIPINRIQLDSRLITQPICLEFKQLFWHTENVSVWKFMISMPHYKHDISMTALPINKKSSSCAIEFNTANRHPSPLKCYELDGRFNKLNI